MRENQVTTSDLILPVFVIEGENKTEEVSSMPGVKRMSIDLLVETATRIHGKGIPAIVLFPVIGDAHKSLRAG